MYISPFSATSSHMSFVSFTDYAAVVFRASIYRPGLSTTLTGRSSWAIKGSGGSFRRKDETLGWAGKLVSGECIFCSGVRLISLLLQVEFQRKSAAVRSDITYRELREPRLAFCSWRHSKALHGDQCKLVVMVLHSIFQVTDDSDWSMHGA